MELRQLKELLKPAPPWWMMPPHFVSEDWMMWAIAQKGQE